MVHCLFRFIVKSLPSSIFRKFDKGLLFVSYLHGRTYKSGSLQWHSQDILLVGGGQWIGTFVEYGISRLGLGVRPRTFFLSESIYIPEVNFKSALFLNGGYISLRYKNIMGILFYNMIELVTYSNIIAASLFHPYKVC